MKTKYTALLAASLLASCPALAQTDFRYDNKVYKTLYPKDICTWLAKADRPLLIDVRTPGEFADTSSENYLNLGHLKGAINIPIDSMPGRIASLRKYQDRPILLYCSHSQRSRRVSKMLADSGFRQPMNVNGGMSMLNQYTEAELPCRKDLIVHQTPYRLTSGPEAIAMLQGNKDLTVMDVRPREQFEGRDTVEANNLGRLKRAISIPLKEMDAGLAKLPKDKSKPVLVYDLHDHDSRTAANLLRDKGYTDVQVLIGGIYGIIGSHTNRVGLRKELIESTTPYTILNTRETMDMLAATAGLVIIDTRPVKVFNNQSDHEWENLGHLKNAVNLPTAGFAEGIKGVAGKNLNIPILIYGSQAAKCARKAAELGYKNVYMSAGGMWSYVFGLRNLETMHNIGPYLVEGKDLY